MRKKLHGEGVITVEHGQITPGTKMGLQAALGQVECKFGFVFIYSNFIL